MPNKNKTRFDLLKKLGLMGALISLLFSLSIGLTPKPDTAETFAPQTTNWTLSDAAYSPANEGGAFTFAPLALDGVAAFSTSVQGVTNPDALSLAFQTVSNDGHISPWQPIVPMEMEDRPDFIKEDSTALHYSLQLPDNQAAVQFRLTHQGELAADARGLSFSVTTYKGEAPEAKNAATAAVSTSAIITRAEWNPSNTLCPMTWTPQNYAVEKIVIHHTADGKQNSIKTYADAKAAVQATCNYHSRSLGWGDIGYNYLISPTGHVFEGRAGGEGVEAGHAYGANKGSIGIAMIGTYTDQGISAAARESLIKLLADLSERYGLDPTGTSTPLAQGCYSFATPNIGGHREYRITPLKNMNCNACVRSDYNGTTSPMLGCPDISSPSAAILSNATACPGNSFYPTLASIRTAVKGQALLTPGAGQFLAEYYANTSLSGQPVKTLIEGSAGKIDHNWGTAAPTSGVPAEQFSVRWRGTLSVPTEGIYTLSVGSDDGARVYVDNTLVINNWVDQGYTVKKADIGLAKGDHQLRIEYYDNTLHARATFSSAKKTLPTGKFIGRYYTNAVFKGPAFVRQDDALNFNWGTGSPRSTIPEDYFSAVWTGTINVEVADDFLFTLEADDKVRLFVDDMKTPLIDEWQDQATTFSAAKALAIGKHNVRLEYAESRGEAKAKLSWEQAKGTAEYFNNMTLSGSPKRTTQLGEIGSLALNWGTGAPVDGITNERFSARFKGEIDVPKDGLYQLSLGSDDGSRLSVDGKTVLSQWDDHAYVVRDVFLTLKKGKRKIQIDYYENEGAARVSFNWKAVSIPMGQFIGRYYANNKASGTPVFSRIDKSINFDWKRGSPDPAIAADLFSAVWDGTINIPAEANTLFTLLADDKVSLYVDDMKTPLIGEWQDQATTFTASKKLSAGPHKVRLKYAESYGEARVKLQYSAVGGTVDFFDNINLSGSPKKTTNIGNIGALDYRWGSSAPLSVIPADRFSARFKGDISIPADGTYVLTLGSDDGARLYVNDKLVLDLWKDHPYLTRNVYMTLKKGKVPVRIDYYEKGGEARIGFSWKKINVPVGQFIGRYYANGKASGVPVFSRVDKAIDFNWKSGSPDADIPKDVFSVTWDGKVSVPADDQYAFTLIADDKVELFVDNMKTPLIGEWKDQNTTLVATKALTAGEHTIKLRYAESYGLARVKLSWKPVSSLEFSSAGGVTATKEDGTALLKVPKDTTLRLSYSTETKRYYLIAGSLSASSELPVLLAATTGSPRLITYENFGYSPHNKYNTFRGSLLIKEKNGLNIINRVSVEDYLRGLGETGLNSDPEYTKALIVAARTYALYNLQTGGKHASQGFILNNTASDQVYYGYEYEQLGGANSVLANAVKATTGKVITHKASPHQNNLIIATYYSQTGESGQTCGQSDPADNDRCTWGTADGKGNKVVAWPWIPLEGVADPWWMKDGACYKSNNTGRVGSGHGYGMSGRGAYCFATEEDKDMAWLLNYYYSGIKLESYPLDTTKLTIDIGLETIKP